MRIALLVVAALALVGFVVVAWVLPGMEQAKTREAARALIAGAEAAKQQVAAAAQKSGKLAGAGQGVKLQPKVTPEYGELKWLVADNGEIRGWNEKNAIEIALVPAFQSGRVSWLCKGYPVSSMPATCGGGS